MKDILILSQVNKPELSEFITNVNNSMNRARISQTTYDDLVIFFKDNKMSVHIRSLDRDIDSFDIVHFKTSIQRDITAAIARYAESKGVKIVDPIVKYFPTTSKLYQYALLSGGDVRTPDSVFVTPNVLKGSFELLEQHLGAPFILKDIHGSKGRFNEVISDKESFLRVCERAVQEGIYVIAQGFTPNDGDYRVLIMGGEVKLVIYRRRKDDTTHLNNTSQGGIGTLLPESNLPREVIDWSLGATDTMGRDISGVDVVLNKSDDKWYYFEVNDGPQISTGSFLDEKVKVVAEYFDEIASEDKDSKNEKKKTIIGRAEKVTFPLLGNAVLDARIDTGATTSSMWATDITETDSGLSVRFASQDHEVYSHTVTFKHYDRVRVASSMGQEQIRYKVKMPVVLGGRRIFASFTLADRSTQVYPVLIGRRTLRGKFIVDVDKGTPLLEEEKRRSQQLQNSLIEERI